MCLSVVLSAFSLIRDDANKSFEKKVYKLHTTLKFYARDIKFARNLRKNVIDNKIPDLLSPFCVILFLNDPLTNLFDAHFL